VGVREWQGSKILERAEGMSKLEQYAIRQLMPKELDWKVADVLQANGDWDVRKLAELLPSENILNSPTET